MIRRFSIPALLVAFAAISSIPAAAYYHFVYYLTAGQAPAKFDLAALPSKTVWFFVSEDGPSSFQNNDNFASVVAQIRHAAEVWNGVASSDLRVGFGGFEHAGTLQNTPAADVVFEDLAPGVLGYGGPTMMADPVVPVTGAPWVPIARSAIHLNVNGLAAPFPSYSESFFLVTLHEMGHALGLQHTFTSSTMSTATTAATSLTNPLDADDIAGISVLYPNANLAQTGSISGRITTGGNGVHLESVVAMRAGAGAVSAFTNPDGTYRIDGVTPGQYYVYAHALPPDADIQGPWNPDGTVAAASGPTDTRFYPGVTDLVSAKPVGVEAGQVSGNIDIDVASLPALPIYDVSVYGYFNNYTIAVKPASVDRTAGKATVVLAGVGLGSGGQAPGLDARFLGDSVVVATGGVRPYEASGYTYVALDLGYTLFGSLGPQHMILTTPGFIHVLPTALHLTEKDPPTVDSVTPNGDGSLTVTGSNWSSGVAIYFDGIPATVESLNLTDPAAAVVVPPPGIAGQTAVLTAYNPDGQNSQFVQSANPATYTWDAAAPAPVIVSISPASLPAGAEATVDITGSGFNLTPGQATAGFGTSDIAVRQIFVLGPNHLQANVSVAPGAALSNPDVSAFSGFQMATATAGFQVAPAVDELPAPIPILTNALPGLNGSYASAIVSLYGSNLAVPGTVPVITFNGEQAEILYSSATQINLKIPGDLPAGPASLQLFNGAVNAYPLTISIDAQPASITAVEDNGGAAISASNPALPGDLVTVSLSGFAPDGAQIAPAQVQVSLNGAMRNALSVTQPGPGVYQVGFLLNSDEAAGDSQPLIVYLNGRSSYPAAVAVGASTVTALAPAALSGN